MFKIAFVVATLVCFAHAKTTTTTPTTTTAGPCSQLISGPVSDLITDVDLVCTIVTSTLNTTQLGGLLSVCGAVQIKDLTPILDTLLNALGTACPIITSLTGDINAIIK